MASVLIRPGPLRNGFTSSNLLSDRFPYHNGDCEGMGRPNTLPTSGRWPDHTTRAVAFFSLDVKKMFLAVGSASNVDDPDTHPRARISADILTAIPANCALHVFAYGIRNAVVGSRESATWRLLCPR